MSKWSRRSSLEAERQVVRIVARDGLAVVADRTDASERLRWWSRCEGGGWGKGDASEDERDIVAIVRRRHRSGEASAERCVVFVFRLLRSCPMFLLRYQV